MSPRVQLSRTSLNSVFLGFCGLHYIDIVEVQITVSKCDWTKKVQSSADELVGNPSRPLQSDSIVVLLPRYGAGPFLS